MFDGGVGSGQIELILPDRACRQSWVDNALMPLSGRRVATFGETVHSEMVGISANGIKKSSEMPL